MVPANIQPLALIQPSGPLDNISLAPITGTDAELQTAFPQAVAMTQNITQHGLNDPQAFLQNIERTQQSKLQTQQSDLATQEALRQAKIQQNTFAALPLGATQFDVDAVTQHMQLIGPPPQDSSGKIDLERTKQAVNAARVLQNLYAGYKVGLTGALSPELTADRVKALETAGYSTVGLSPYDIQAMFTRSDVQEKIRNIKTTGGGTTEVPKEFADFQTATDSALTNLDSMEKILREHPVMTAPLLRKFTAPGGALESLNTTFGQTAIKAFAGSPNRGSLTSQLDLGAAPENILSQIHARRAAIIAERANKFKALGLDQPAAPVTSAPNGEVNVNGNKYVAIKRDVKTGQRWGQLPDGSFEKLPASYQPGRPAAAPAPAATPPIFGNAPIVAAPQWNPQPGIFQ